MTKQPRPFSEKARGIEDGMVCVCVCVCLCLSMNKEKWGLI